jgi:hypothetical protein
MPTTKKYDPPMQLIPEDLVINEEDPNADSAKHSWIDRNPALEECRRVSREKQPTAEQIDAYIKTSKPTPGIHEYFVPTFHPRKQISIADQDLIRKTREAAKDVQRESFFDSPVPPPIGDTSSPTSFASILKRSLPFIPPPPAPEKDYQLASINRRAPKETPEQKEERLRAAQEEKERKEEHAKKFSGCSKQRDSWLPPSKCMRVVPLVVTGRDRPSAGKKEDWVILFEKKALMYLRPFGQFTQEEREFDHKPTTAEIATRLTISKDKLEECLNNGLVVIQGRRVEDSEPASKAGH